MPEHMPKEPLPKSTRKAQPSTDAAPSKAQGPNNDMIRLQRLVGNHAVQRMLIQTKMTVGAADDPYEREADAVADKVMAQRDTTIQRAGMEEEEPLQGKRVDVVQRESEGGEAEEEELLQGKRIDIVQRAGMEEEEPLQGKRVDMVQREDEGSEAEEEELLQGKRVDIVQRAGMEEEEPLQGKRVDMVQREDEGGEAEDEELQMKRADIQRQGVPINDDTALEQEADQMGAQVSRKNDKQINLNESFDVEQDVESKISAKSGNGQAIPDVNRQMFESSMGHDFSGVNVHADTESDSLNKQLGARAFTTGSDIFFRQGEYNPASSGGQELLAHELTHVVQQGGAGVQKKSEDDK